MRVRTILAGAAALMVFGAVSVRAETTCSFWAKQPTANVRKHNNWAVRCGLIRQADADSLSDRYYALGYRTWIPTILPMHDVPFLGVGPDDLPAHQPGCPGQGLPFDVRLDTVCYRDCLSTAMSVTSGGAERPLASLQRTPVSTVTTLMDRMTLAGATLGERSIRKLISTPYDRPILIFHLSSGEVLEVTDNHPMVVADGRVVQAQDVQADEALLRADGDVSPVERIEQRPYSGQVWTVRPDSERKNENIMLVKGLMTGTSYFTERWAAETTHLVRADTLNVHGL